MLAVEGGNLSAVIWDFEQPVQNLSDRPFYTKLLPAHEAAPVQLRVTHLAPSAAYRLEVHRTGFHANDAYSAYLEMGAPKDLSPTQVAHLNELTRDLPEENRIVHAGKDGSAEIEVPMRSNDVVSVSLRRIDSDRSNSRN
jgi:xylan 1,4-beta-xylosidase